MSNITKADIRKIFEESISFSDEIQKATEAFVNHVELIVSKHGIVEKNEQNGRLQFNRRKYSDDRYDLDGLCFNDRRTFVNQESMSTYNDIVYHMRELFDVSRSVKDIGESLDEKKKVVKNYIEDMSKVELPKSYADEVNIPSMTQLKIMIREKKKELKEKFSRAEYDGISQKIRIRYESVDGKLSWRDGEMKVCDIYENKLRDWASSLIRNGNYSVGFSFMDKDETIYDVYFEIMKNPDEKIQALRDLNKL